MKGTEKGTKKKPCNGGEERLGYCLGSGVAWDAGGTRAHVEESLWSEEEDRCLLPGSTCPLHSSSSFFGTLRFKDSLSHCKGTQLLLVSGKNEFTCYLY